MDDFALAVIPEPASCAGLIAMIGVTMARRHA
jgi:hypothetical protein